MHGSVPRITRRDRAGAAVFLVSIVGLLSPPRWLEPLPGSRFVFPLLVLAIFAVYAADLFAEYERERERSQYRLGRQRGTYAEHGRRRR